MIDTTTPARTVASLEVPDARLHYEVRGSGPLVVLVGAPMDADAFAPLADLLAGDHTVLTTDPRGVNRSPVIDPEQDSTPEQRADDLSRLLTHLDAGPAIVFGSSGGAVTALAFAQAHPEQTHLVIAHEPPLDELLEDRKHRHAVTEDIIAAYRFNGRAAAWRLFLADANIVMPEEAFEYAFGGELDPQAAADEDHFFFHELRATTHWAPDINALSRSGPRIIVGIGRDSAGQVCDRTSRALAAALGTEPTIFPGDHTGFVDDPERFLDRLRRVLAED
jgi:pimeloyl-ACP methyl ester carboxylesterase